MNVPVVIWCASYPHDHRPIGAWLKDYDLEAHGGLAVVHFTDVLAEAMRFESMQAAMVAVMEQPRAKPMREDGRPNRPLRGLSMLFLSIAEADELIQERRRRAGRQ